MTIRWCDHLSGRDRWQAVCRGHYWEGPERTNPDMARLDIDHHLNDTQEVPR